MRLGFGGLVAEPNQLGGDVCGFVGQSAADVVLSLSEEGGDGGGHGAPQSEKTSTVAVNVMLGVVPATVAVTRT